MNKHLQHIINQLRSEGKDYTHFKSLLDAIKVSGLDISKDEILEFVANDYRIQLHTTPNSIAKLISHLAQKNKPQSAIDICCGTGNILYYLQNDIDDLTGVEVSDNIAALTKYFIPELNIITADTFQYPFTRKYNLVVGNIPFGMRIELGGKSISVEEAFLRKAYELLTNNGRAILLVPYTVLFTNLFQNFRRDFVSFVEEVITLPSGVIRNTEIKTALLVFSKQETSEVKLTELKDFERLTEEYIKSVSLTYINQRLFGTWDIKHLLSRETAFYKELDSIKTNELQDLAEIIRGKMIYAVKLKEQGDYVYLKPMHLQNSALVIESGIKYVSKEDLTDKDYRYLIQPGDIVISTIFNDLKMYVYQAGDVPAFASNNLAIIRSAKQDYIFTYLQTEEGKRIFKTQAENLKKGVAIPHLTLKDLASIKIPILPIADLNKLGNKSIETATKTELINQLELLKSISQKGDTDLPVLLKEPDTLIQSQALSDVELVLKFLNDRFKKIEDQLSVVNNKLDSLLDIVKELKSDFSEVRRLPREEEEKLFKLYQKIDARLDSVYKNERNTIEDYIAEIKRWLDLWDKLDIQSQKFLPIAEFIFDELSRLEDADYAPFVVQYCRTLENEILKKLFEAYHSNGLANIHIEDLVKTDLVNQKTRRFADMVKRNKITYTLGEMNFIMALLKEGGSTLGESPLLQHFRAFTITYFDERVIEADFLKDVDRLTNEFRNKAAHPYSVSIQLARECQALLRKSLNVFLESLKSRQL